MTQKAKPFVILNLFLIYIFSSLKTPKAKKVAKIELNLTSLEAALNLRTVSTASVKAKQLNGTFAVRRTEVTSSNFGYWAELVCVIYAI